MYIIGLTGGIACGKSTVARLLKKRGARGIDADALTHTLLQPRQALYRLYVAHFGAEILTAGGTIDRRALGARLFARPEERAWVDTHAHPVIRAAAEKRLAALKREGARLVVLDVPLLFEAGWDTLADEIWVASLPEELEVARLMERSSLTEAEARVRIAAQMPLAEKARRADFVLDNSGTLEELAAQVDRGLARLSDKKMPLREVPSRRA